MKVGVFEMLIVATIGVLFAVALRYGIDVWAECRDAGFSRIYCFWQLQ